MPPNLVVPEFGQPREASSVRGAFFMLATTVELALGHHQAGHFQEAERLYHTSLRQQPEDFNAWYLLGILARQAGDCRAAAAHLIRAVELKPDWAEAHFQLGVAYEVLGNWAAAADCFCRATECFAAYAEAQVRLAMVLRRLGKTDEAIAAYRLAAQLLPESVEVHNDLGEMLATAGQLAGALACFERAGVLRPDSAEIQNNLGNVFRELGNSEQAITAFSRAVALRPDLEATHVGLGALYQERGDLDQAAASFQRALELNSRNAAAWNNLGNVLKAQGSIEAAVDCFRRAIEWEPNLSCAHSNLIYALHFDPRSDSAAIYAAHRRWNEQFAQQLSGSIGPHANQRSPERRLRIGYVSADFRDHCQSFFTLPLFREHDREGFEVICYSNARYEDSVTERLRSQVAGWRSIRAFSDETAAQLIREDRIDILVDLTMHMAGGRPLLFARKPAPVQICWLAYPGTTGLSTVDYRLTDPYLNPPGVGDGDYSEVSLRLADTFWCYDPLASEPAVNGLPARSQGSVTFGSVNNFCKANAGVLKLWAQVLRVVDDARLLLLAPVGAHRERCLRLFEQEGVRRERIEFAGLRSRREYLELFHRIDVSLDTFPSNGHTTSLDSLWMGVPVVSLAGNTPMGRAGLSLLTNLGLADLVTQSPAEFVDVSVGLAADVGRIADLRSTLRERLQQSVLMNAERFAKNVEGQYRQVWRRWCERQWCEDQSRLS